MMKLASTPVQRPIKGVFFRFCAHKTLVVISRHPTSNGSIANDLIGISAFCISKTSREISGAYLKMKKPEANPQTHATSIAA